MKYKMLVSGKRDLYAITTGNEVEKTKRTKKKLGECSHFENHGEKFILLPGCQIAHEKEVATCKKTWMLEKPAERKDSKQEPKLQKDRLK